jgi:uncharacterized sulfatase
MANFKGQNERSVKDVVAFLKKREQQDSGRPLFLFLNLMETHLPFWPPGQFVDKVAPYFRESKEARTIMRTWNREAYRWAAPLAEPLGELENNVLNDMYDAEVAYQDDYLGHLLDALRSRKRQSETLTVIVADHGDGIGDHGYMGHAFVAYQELVHVPLIVDWPAAWTGEARIATPVSTRRVFHTMLAAANGLSDKVDGEVAGEANRLSLHHTVNGRDPEQNTAVSEVYPPLNFVKAVERRQPELLDAFHCLDERHAIVRQIDDDTYKLIHLDYQPHELFDLPPDPMEEHNVLELLPAISEQLSFQLKGKVEELHKRRERLTSASTIDVESDSQLMQRLRGLGYLD